ncbi:MAG: phosphate ABC transporter permease PstA [Actinomycetota bacterium]|nr:phosphate ABC transporter permease PstA [Actinomycetota bacterium]
MRTITTSDAVAVRLAGRKVQWRELAFEGALLLALLVSLLFLVTLLVDITIKAMPVLTGRPADFISSGLSPDPTRAGVGTSILGSVTITAGVALFAFPLGIGTAIYLEEYAANNRLTQLIRTNIRNLAGVPSIVFGILGFAIFVRLVAAVGLGGSVNGRNVLAAGLTLAALVLPIVIITASEALNAVPSGIREAGFGVGATRWEVTRHHVLPSAAPGILTGTVLTLSRAFGETAPLLLVGAVTGFFTLGEGASVMDKLTSAYTALPVTVFSWSRQPSDEFRALAAAAIVALLAVLLTANAAAIILRNRYERKW